MRKKKWAMPYIDSHGEIIIKIDDVQPEVIDTTNYDRFHLEIGCGKGDFIIGLAQKNPTDLCIAVEKDPNAAAVAAKKVEELQLSNVRILLGDGALLSNWIKPHSVDVLYLNHSDPWPKNAHEKRRLTYKTFLDNYVLWLGEEGSLIQKTDNAHFFDYSLVSILSHQFMIEKLWVNYQVDDDPSDVLTEYERKFRDLNQPIYRAIFKVKHEKA